MISNDQIAQTICKSYPGNDEIEDPSTITMDEFYKQARMHDQFGDTLFEFIAIEAMEGGQGENDRLDIGHVIRVLERGRDDLQTVITALWQLDNQDPDRESCFMCGARFDKGKGHTVEPHDVPVNVCDRCKDGLDGLEKTGLPDNIPYEMCKLCDHFIEDNSGDTTPGVAKHLHLEDGEQEFDHDATPSGQAHTLSEWEGLRPDLFKEHPDGKIGPNSVHHSRRGKEK